MTCSFCRRSQRDGFADFECDGIDTVAECKREHDRVPKLSEENERFRFLLLKILPGLCDPFGGFKFEAIDYVLQKYGVPEEQHSIVHDKCLIVIDVIREIRERNNKS